jgi:hypothetical protein
MLVIKSAERAPYIPHFDGHFCPSNVISTYVYSHDERRCFDLTAAELLHPQPADWREAPRTDLTEAEALRGLVAAEDRAGHQQLAGMHCVDRESDSGSRAEAPLGTCMFRTVSNK